MKIKPPLTITHESQRLYEALLAQVKLNEELQKQLLEAAEVIKKLTKEIDERT